MVTQSREILIPFQIGQDGGVASTTDPVEQMVGHLTSIIGTNPPERAMRPDYGVHGVDQTFEPMDPLLVQHLRTDVLRSVQRWEPKVALVIVQSVFPQVDAADADSAIQIEIRFQLRGSLQQHRAVVNVGGSVVETTSQA